MAESFASERKDREYRRPREMSRPSGSGRFALRPFLGYKEVPMRPPKSPALVIAFLLAAFAALWSAASIGAPPRSKTAPTSAAILPEKRRAEVTNAWQKWRIENLLPALMRRTGIDMWLVMNREYAEDPVYFTLVPQPIMYSGGQVVLIFHDRGPEAGLGRRGD